MAARQRHGTLKRGLIGDAVPKPLKYFHKGNVCYGKQAVQAEEPMAVKGNGRTLSAYYFLSTRTDDPLNFPISVFKRPEPPLFVSKIITDPSPDIS